jgi:membrane protease YdiL (CAAX protease family)
MKRALLQPRSLSTGWALASVGGYLASFVLFLIGLNIAVVLAWWGLASAGTFALADLASLSASPMPSGLLLVTTLVQFFGMLGLAIGGWRLISALHRQRGIPTDSASRAFGFRSAKPVAYAAALAGGLTVGWFPGWLAAVLRDALPWLDLGAVELITAHLEQGPALTRVGMLIVIGVLGPIVEELVFRGWLWRSLRRSFSGPVVILITSVLFSLVHLDPV